jgi:site-specific DNA-methyltransferase (adenine-specific)
MESVLVGGIPVDCDAALSRRWHKKAKLIVRDGKVFPWEPEGLVAAGSEERQKESDAARQDGPGAEALPPLTPAEAEEPPPGPKPKGKRKPARVKVDSPPVNGAVDQPTEAEAPPLGLQPMTDPPAWAEGFPVEVEAFVSERYLQTPPEGAAVVRARNGVVLDDPKPVAKDGKAEPSVPEEVAVASSTDTTAPNDGSPIMARPPIHRLADPQTELHVGDCRVVLPALPAESIDLAVTDPPYNIGLTYHDDYDDNQETQAFLGLLEDAVRQVHRVLTPTGSLFLFMGTWLQAEALVLLKRIGFHYRRTIIWYNTFGQAQQRNFTPSWTAIHYMTKHPREFTFNADAIRVPSARQLRYNDKRASPKGKLPDDVWVLLPDVQAPECFQPDSDLWLESRVCGTFKERVGHVTQLPLPLVERIVKVASNPGELVLDPFAGTATVLVASRRLQRRSIGIELNAGTADLARRRLEEEPGQPTR